MASESDGRRQEWDEYSGHGSSPERARVDLGFQAGDAAVGTGTPAARLRQLHEDHLLRLTDYVLSEVTGPGPLKSSNVRMLEDSVLLLSKSKWTIGAGWATGWV